MMEDQSPDIPLPGLPPEPDGSKESPSDAEDDGWLCLDDSSSSDSSKDENDEAEKNGSIAMDSIPLPEETQKKKLDPKELIQRKLLELKVKARKEAEQNAEARKETKDIEIRSSSTHNVVNADDIPPAQTESERILDELFSQFAAPSTSNAKQQAEEMSKTLNHIEEEIEKLETENKQKLEKSSKKKKKDKKSKKSKHKKSKKKYDDPELDPEFFNVPSPKPLPKEDGAPKATSNKSTAEEKRSRSRERSHRHQSADRDPRHRTRDRRDRSRDRRRERERDRSRDRRDKRKRSSRSRSRDRHRSRRDRSRSRSRSRGKMKENPFYIDKEKLRRIAFKQLAQLDAAGKSVYEKGITAEDLAQIKSGGASLNELTAFCKTLSRGSDDNSDTEELLNIPCTEEENDTSDVLQSFIKAAPIVMNIKNAKQLPIQSTEEKAKLRVSFPVSSGTHHRKDEPNEWTPVQPTDNNKNVFKEASMYKDDEDIAVLIAKRLAAVNKLKKNPNDKKTKDSIAALDERTSKWSESKNVPGAFTGVIEARMLTPEELAPSLDKRNQAWVKKDTFTRARPVEGGIGKFLLQKMGWQTGQGLGKGSTGSVEPLVLDFNTNRQGLTAPEERARSAAISSAGPVVYDQVSAMRGGGKKRTGGSGSGLLMDMSDKHPVSAIMEICSKRRWNPPSWEIIHESGPSHRKNFIMRVTVNGTTYQPSLASNNKKEAKTMCATAALQAMGLLPRENVQTVTVPTPPAATEPPPPHLQSVPAAPQQLQTVPHIDFSAFR